MFAATYKRWSFTWGSNLRNLIGKILVFWKGGFSWEVLLAKGGRTWSKPRNHVNHIKMSLKHAKFSINWNNTLFLEYWYPHAGTPYHRSVEMFGFQVSAVMKFEKVNLSACIYRAVFFISCGTTFIISNEGHSPKHVETNKTKTESIKPLTITLQCN